MEIKAQRWLAVLFQCPQCGNQTIHPRVTPTKRHRDESFACHNWRCQSTYEIAERRYYTTFVIEPGISFTTIAGTLDKLGPFKICDIVHPNIRAFRKWYARRKAEQDEQARVYFERERVLQIEYEAKVKRWREEERLLKDAEKVVYEREHAAELLAEQVAQAAWPEEQKSSLPTDDESLGEFDDECPF